MSDDLAARMGAVLGRIKARGLCEWQHRQPKPLFFGAEGQWYCECGVANHELRKKCRNCGGQKEERKP